VFRAVSEGTADRGILAIENTLGGSIHENFDLLLRNDLSIVGEHHFRVRHCLITLPGVKKHDIKKVSSHWQALAQCAGYTERHGYTQEAAYDTAGAVRLLKESGDRTMAAVASRRAAEVFDMQVLEEGIEDNPENYTRFLLLARDHLPAEEPVKTSIVFSQDNKPGSLFRAMAAFALRDIDLTKIESRPLKGRPFEYFFYLDFLGHAETGPGAKALSQLAETSTFLRILGTYKRST
jgi:prephenate dehydratase